MLIRPRRDDDLPACAALDVDTELASAIALYEARGWTRAGTVTVRWSDARVLTEYVYLGPDPATSAS